MVKVFYLMEMEGNHLFNPVFIQLPIPSLPINWQLAVQTTRLTVTVLALSQSHFFFPSYLINNASRNFSWKGCGVTKETVYSINLSAISSLHLNLLNIPSIHYRTKPQWKILAKIKLQSELNWIGGVFWALTVLNKFGWDWLDSMLRKWNAFKINAIHSPILEAKPVRK